MEKLVYLEKPATAGHEDIMTCSAFILGTFYRCKISFKIKLGKTATCPLSLQ